MDRPHDADGRAYLCDVDAHAPVVAFPQKRPPASRAILYDCLK